MVIDIIIPSLTLPEHQNMVRECISSIRSSEIDHSFNIILMESNDNFIQLGQDITLSASKPFNYNKTLDIGIKNSNSDWIVMANNDLIFEKNWFTEILNAQKERPDISSFSSWNNYGGWHQNRLPNAETVREGYGIGYELCGWILIIERKNYLKLNLVNDVSFWCSDNIYSDEIQKNNLKHALVRKSIVNHLTSRTLFNGKVNVKNLTEDQVKEYENWRRNINI